jgi:hypothetical protein
MRSIIIAIGLVLALAAPTIGATHSWPNECKDEPTAQYPDGRWDRDMKQAAKLWKGLSFSGGKQVECGTRWAAWNDFAERAYDNRFGDAQGWGEVENMNDQVRSFILINKDRSQNTCFVFYENYGFLTNWWEPRVLSVWVPKVGNDSRWKRTWAKVPSLGGVTWWSSMKVMNDGQYDSRGACEALTENWGVLGENYPTNVTRWAYTTHHGVVQLLP